MQKCQKSPIELMNIMLRLRSELTCELRETMSDVGGGGVARFIQLTMLLAQLRDVCSHYKHHFSEQFNQQFQF